MSIPLTARLAAATVLCEALTSAPLDVNAQTPPSPDARPTFKASTDLVQFEVIVTDRQGALTDDLTASDFEVRQDGNVVPLQAAIFVGGVRGRSATQRAGTGAPPTNVPALDAPAEPRDVVVVVDERNMTFDSHTRARTALRGFVDDMLASGDRILIASTAPGQDETLAFTSDRAALHGRIDALTWDGTFRTPITNETSDLECTNTGLTSSLTSNVMQVGSFGVLSDLLAELRAEPGRKVLVWMTDGFSEPRCPDATFALTERIRRLTDLANRAGVVVYGVQSAPWSSNVVMASTRASGSMVSGPRPNTRAQHILDEHLRFVAEHTGGLVRRSNDIDESLRDVQSDGRRYYLLAYEPPPGTFSERFQYRSLTVKVRRPGAQVRSRAGFYSVTDETVATK